MNYINTFKTISLALIFTLGLSYVFAWTGPTQAPTGGNVAAPVNVGDVGQTKTGYFGASEVLAATSTASVYCIGTSCINSWPSVGASVPAGALWRLILIHVLLGGLLIQLQMEEQLLGLGIAVRRAL